MKLVQKITLLAAGLAVFISAGLGVAAVVISEKVAADLARKSLFTEAELGAKLVKETAAGELAILQELADRPETETMDWNIQRQSLQNDVAKLGYLDFGIVTPDGKVSYIIEHTTADLADRDYIKKALGGQQAISDVIISKVIGKPVVMYAVPITTAAGTAGALIARKDGNALSALTGTMTFGNSGYAYLVNRDGVVVAHRNKDMVMNRFSPIEEAKKNPSLASLASVFKSVIQQKKGIGNYTMNGTDMVAGYIPVEGMDWVLVVTISRNELLSGIKDLRNTMVLTALVFLITGILAALFLAKSISGPLTGMLPVLEIISGGNLTRRLAVTSKDEVGMMATKFNSSIASLAGMVTTAKQSSEKLNDVVDNLSENMKETAGSVNRIIEGISNIKQQTGNQVTAVSGTHVSIEAIKSNTEKFDALVENQAASVEESSAAIEKMVSNIQSVTDILQKNSVSMEELLAAAEQGKNDIQQESDIIAAVGKASEGLIDASTIIRGIADQTNLLAMNAAIEAAHAGEAGKGFSVVAEEIRKLSETSSSEGKAIASELENLQERIHTVTALAEQSLVHFSHIMELMVQVKEQETGIRNSMQEQSDGSSQILEAIRDINGTTVQVKDESGHMLESSRKIFTEMNHLLTITEDMNKNVDTMASGAVKINETVQNVNVLTQNTRDSISAFTGQVSRFETE